MSVDLSVHISIKVEDNSLQMDEHDVGGLFQKGFLCDVALLVTEFTHPIVDHLSLRVVLEGLGEVVPILDAYLVVIEGLISLFLLATVVTDHLDHCGALKTTVDKMAIRGIFQVFLDVIE